MYGVGDPGREVIGDPATAMRLSALQRALQSAHDPNAALGLQQMMAAQQMTGANNLVGAANANRQGLDPLTGVNPGDMARQKANQNQQAMQDQYNRNIMALQQARNSATPMANLGIPGYYPRAGVNPLISGIQGGQ
jgi:hypothetical protein